MGGVIPAELLAACPRDLLVYRYRLVPSPGFDYVSPTCTELTGYTPEEHYADPELGLKLVHPDDRARVEALGRGERSRASAEADSPIVVRWLRRDGTLLVTEQRTSPVYDRAGKLVAIDAIALDVTERVRSQRLLAAHYAVSSALLDRQPLAEAAPRILRALGESLGWDVAELWLVDGATGRLRWERARAAPSFDLAAFSSLSRRLVLAPNQGFLGQVWSSSQSVWICDLAAERGFHRPHLASQLRLHSVFAFPLQRNGEVVGLIACYDRAIQPRDDELLRVATNLGRLIGGLTAEGRAGAEAKSEPGLVRRKVTRAGVIWLAGQSFYVSRRLSGQYVQARIADGKLRISASIPLEREISLPPQLARSERRHRPPRSSGATPPA